MQSRRRTRSDPLHARFPHPCFDYLVIGGGLSLVLTAVVKVQAGVRAIVDPAALFYFILLCNFAHFASSTVRLYLGLTFQALLFLTIAFPLVVLVVLTSSLCVAGTVGPHLKALFI